MKANRREFLKGIAMAAGAAGVAGGCANASGGRGEAGGAPMRNFRCAPMKRIRVGVVGCGARGSGAVKRLPSIPGIEVVAVCDIRPECAERAVKAVEDKTGRKPLAFSGGDEEFKRLCDLPQVDVVYNTTSWNAHAKVSLYALNAAGGPLTQSALTLGALLASRRGREVFRDRHGFIAVIWGVTHWRALLP